ncbi:hypothetical protein PPACK8108_LOCUS6051, partial [Phakopsora pachyrhizi]
MALNTSQSTLAGPQAPNSLTSVAGIGQTSPMPILKTSTTPSLPPYSEPPTPVSIPDDLVEDIIQYMERGGSPVSYWYQATSPVLTEAGNSESLPSSMDIEIIMEASHPPDIPVLSMANNLREYPVYPDDFQRLYPLELYGFPSDERLQYPSHFHRAMDCFSCFTSYLFCRLGAYFLMFPASNMEVFNYRRCGGRNGKGRMGKEGVGSAPGVLRVGFWWILQEFEEEGVTMG